MTMNEILRDSTFGQLVRFATKNKYFKYPEEQPDFVIPWKGMPSTPTGGLSRQISRGLQNIPGSQQTEADALQRQASNLERRETNVIVPQTTKDGVILIEWYSDDDAANPQNWSSGWKTYIMIILWLYTFSVYSSSSIYTSGQQMIQERFGLSYAEGSTILSLYVAGYGLGPLLFSPLSEIPSIGRNIPYVFGYFWFVILAIPTALIQNYPGLLVLRFLTGFMGSPALATGGATAGDLYNIFKLPYGLAFWTAGAFSGPALGPLLSGYAVTAIGWRWAFWEILILAGPIFVVWFFTMPETSADAILYQRAKRLRAVTGNNNYRTQAEIVAGSKTTSTIIYDALAIPFIITIRDPAVLFTNVFSAIIYGTYYSFFEAFPLTYIGIYHFNIGELSLVYAGAFVPAGFVAIGIYFAYQFYYLEPDMRKRGPRAQEHRLVPAVFAVWLLPISLFWFGWTANRHIHWAVSIVGIAFFVLGSFILFQCIFMYLPLSYPAYAASLFAANDAMRSAFAAGGIIFAHPMYVNLGIGRGVSILGGLMVGGSAGIVILYYVGARLRAKSKFTGMPAERDEKMIDESSTNEQAPEV